MSTDKRERGRKDPEFHLADLYIPLFMFGKFPYFMYWFRSFKVQTWTSLSDVSLFSTCEKVKNRFSFFIAGQRILSGEDPGV